MLKPESLVGKQIDQFRLDQYVARGAMGLVFKAFDTVLVRAVALKLIPKAMEEGLSKEELAAREEARKRLIQEAKAAGRLTHPNIVTIYDVQEHFSGGSHPRPTGRCFLRPHSRRSPQATDTRGRCRAASERAGTLR